MPTTRVTKPTLLRLTIHAVAGKRFVPFIRKHVLLAHPHLKSPLGELSIALVGDARMSSLHERFMNIAGPTDVLTFPLDFDAAGSATAGEIIICVPEALRQARVRRTEPRKELLLYALHGMLHLCGFDDRTESAFRQMHRMEDDILIQLGLGPVFGEVEPAEARRKAPGKTTRKASRAAGKPTGDKRSGRARNGRVGV